MTRTRQLAWALLAALLLSLGLVAACSDDDNDGSGAETPPADATQAAPGTSLEASPEIEAYFAAFDAQDNGFAAMSAALDPQFAEINEQNALTLAPSLLRELTNAIEIFVVGLATLEPPEEAEQVHSEAVEAGEDALSRYRELLRKANSARTYEELLAIFEDDDLVAAFAALDQACNDATAIAATYGIQVELTCA